MDINIALSFIPALLIVLGINFVLGEDSLPWWKTRVHSATDSTCGQKLFLPLGFRQQIILLYDGSVFNSSCVIQIKSRDSLRNAKLCVKMENIYGNGEDFRLFFGEFPCKSTNDCYFWQVFRDEVCSNHTTVYAIINASDTLGSGMKFRLKVSRSKIISKRSTISKRSSWGSWSPSDTWSYWNGWSSRTISPWSSWNGWSSRTRSPWSSWNSWSSWSATPSWRSDFEQYEREKEERREKSARAGIIILVILGSLGVIVCCIAIAAWAKYRGSVTSGESHHPAHCTEPGTSVTQDRRPVSSAPPEYDVVVSETNEENSASSLGPPEGNMIKHEIYTPFLSRCEEDTTNTVESSVDAEPEAPPPSYSSLFSANKHTEHGLT